MNNPMNKSNLANKDWYAIACKIRKQNDELKEEIKRLETLINEQKQQIKVQVIKNQDFQKSKGEYDKKIKDLETKINDSQIRILQQNEQYQKQKLVIENLSQELKKTQQLAANLERDCSLLQDKYNESQYLLQQKEKEIKELSVRLQRQQRYNVKYKTALDHYLSNSSSPPDVNSVGVKSWSEDNDNTQENSTLNNIPLLDKIDQQIEEIDRNLENNNQQIKVNSSNYNQGNNPFLPPINSDNAKKKNNSFLRLPKFGK